MRAAATGRPLRRFRKLPAILDLLSPRPPLLEQRRSFEVDKQAAQAHLYLGTRWLHT